MNALLDALGPVLGPLAVLAAAVLAGLLIYGLLIGVARRLTTDLPELLVFQGALLRRIRRPLALLLPLMVVRLALPVIAAPLREPLPTVLGSVLYFGVVLAVAWLLVGAVSAAEDILVQRSNLEAEDNLRARKLLTQAKILKRIAVVVIGVFALAAILMHYDAFRELGAGLLASAGVAGLVVGLAAQRALGNLLAGIQIAITQPIRVDDVVIVEGDFGWIEEITLTYVVVRVWDLRRIVVPISDFIEKPFQNWTRTSADLLGTVFLYTDYTVPVEALRAEHQRILEASADWNGKAAAVQVTDAKERTVEVRLLQSAANASRLFSLRCEVREKMIAFLQREHPDALPKMRAELQADGKGGNAWPSGSNAPTEHNAPVAGEQQDGTDGAEPSARG